MTKKTSMLAGPKLKIFTDFADSLSKEELIWANGYLSGRINNTGIVAAPADIAATGKKITLAYGTETGNSKRLAIELAAKAKKKGVQAKLVSLDQYRLNDLEKEEYFVTVISTQGEGEPPVGAKKFYDHLHNNGFTIPSMKYAVLALGDTSYPMFCKTGEDIDQQLETLGAKRFFPLEKCDLDYETQAEQWFDSLLASIANTTATNKLLTIADPDTVPKKPTGKKIYQGNVLANINLNAKGSSKATFHIELGVDEIEYLPGDSIGIIPYNDVFVVDEILTLSKIDGDKKVVYKNEEATINELLLSKINISFLLEKFIKQYAELAGISPANKRSDLVELLRQNPLNDATATEQFILSLNSIAPRIYNIASSINAHGSEVHIIALKDTFVIDEKAHTGLCSAFLEDKKAGDTFDFFIQPNKRFRLPADDKDIIMIGPGTGIAPYRSFVAERDATGATGRNWLFFADEKFTTDFYYQTEWQSWFGTGVLTTISLAWSKDGAEIRHIQDKILQQAKQLYEWINAGAYIYLCGEKDPMSKQAEAALLAVIRQEAGLSNEAAVAYFEQLKTDGRYMKDVY